MVAEVDTYRTTHTEFQSLVAKHRPAATKMLWHIVLREMNIVAENGGTGVRISWQAMSNDKPVRLLNLDTDYPTLAIYKTWQYDIELFTRLVASAGFPHTHCDDAVDFIYFGTSE